MGLPFLEQGGRVVRRHVSTVTFIGNSRAPKSVELQSTVESMQGVASRSTSKAPNVALEGRGERDHHLAERRGELLQSLVEYADLT
jgi:hypothetical protein